MKGNYKRKKLGKCFPKKVNVDDVIGFAEFLNKDLKDTLDKYEVRSVKEVFEPLADDQNGLIEFPNYKGEDAFHIYTKTDSVFEAYLKQHIVKWFQSISRKEAA